MLWHLELTLSNRRFSSNVWKCSYISVSTGNDVVADRPKCRWTSSVTSPSMVGCNSCPNSSIHMALWIYKNGFVQQNKNICAKRFFRHWSQPRRSAHKKTWRGRRVKRCICRRELGHWPSWVRKSKFGREWPGWSSETMEAELPRSSHISTGNNLGSFDLRHYLV